jgi:putative MATE family efflux protein
VTTPGAQAPSAGEAGRPAGGIPAGGENPAPETTTARRVIALALPALGALVAEPLFVMADAAIVGHLGGSALAGLSLAGQVLQSAVYMCVFLAYATTAQVARRFGAGAVADAARLGLDGIWLGLGLGVAVMTGGFLLGRPTLRAFGAEGEVLEAAWAYLSWSLAGVPLMMAALAATGALRGFQDTKATLYVAATGAAVNAVLSYVLCFPAGLGIRGSALATVIAQTGMAVWSGGLVLRVALRHGVSLAPRLAGVWASARAGAPLFVRTVSLQGSGLLLVWTATSLGTAALAGQKVVDSIWSLAAMVVDSLAIATQALVGAAIGGASVEQVRAVTRAVSRLGLAAGVGLGVLVAALSPVAPWLFTSDPEVRRLVTFALVAAGLLMPLAARAYVLDGILMGAGDGAYLAAGMAVALGLYAPFAWAVSHWGGQAGDWCLALVWLAYGLTIMTVRCLAYGRRVRRQLAAGAPAWRLG